VGRGAPLYSFPAARGEGEALRGLEEGCGPGFGVGGGGEGGERYGYLKKCVYVYDAKGREINKVFHFGAVGIQGFKSRCEVLFHVHKKLLLGIFAADFLPEKLRLQQPPAAWRRE
jgi:hypothetical protein